LQGFIHYYGGGLILRGNIEQRAVDLAVYIIENRATVRAAARKFGISKSTVHKDLSERLQNINRSLYLQVKEILDINKAERHLRGGLATRKKYMELAQRKAAR
jgi:putative DeoR family transcriptional regulator (stage III sporulation protein D)